jgi:predicted metal-binding membrane protein
MMLTSSVRVRTGPTAAAALGGVAAAAWVALAAGIAGHTSHDEVLGDGQHSAALLGGWLLMVAAMMLPPEITSVAGSRGGSARRWWVVTGAVIAATCTVWTGFAIVALAGDTLVHRLAGSWPAVAGLVTPVLLIGAGVFQLSPAKQRLLDATRHSPDPAWRHALRCLGSCWALMLVMFAVGVGSLAWMAVLTVVMVAERAVRPALVPWLTGLAGVALIIAGLQAAGQHH